MLSKKTYSIDQQKSFLMIALGVYIFVALLSVMLRYPGSLPTDSLRQLQQAQSGVYTDRHPPIGAVLWKVFAWIGRPPAPMFLLYGSLYFVGGAGIALSVARGTAPLAGIVVLAALLSPLLLFFLGIVYSDTAMMAFFVAAIGSVAWWRVQGRRVPAAALALALTLLFVGALTRANAPFGAASLLIYIVTPKIVRTPLRAVLLSLTLAIAGLLASQVVNQRVIGAMSAGYEDSLRLYDLAGIAAQTGDLSALPSSVSLDQTSLVRCYTPLFWDPLVGKLCNFAFSRLPPPGTSERRAIASKWLYEIVRHPLGYAAHRLKHFNAQLNWLVPALQCRFSRFDHSCGTPDPRTGIPRPGKELNDQISHDYLKKNPIVWPITWLIVSVLLFGFASREPPDPISDILKAVLMSGFIYGLLFLFVGVAANQRYFLWTMFSAHIGLAIYAAKHFHHHGRILKTFISIIAILTAVYAAGYIFRLGDITTFTR